MVGYAERGLVIPSFLLAKRQKKAKKYSKTIKNVLLNINVLS